MLYDHIHSDMILAMKEKDKTKLSALRLILNTAKNQKIQTQQDNTDQVMIKLIQKQIKQSEETIADYQKAGRSEQAQLEKDQIAILQAYLPEAPSEEAILVIIETYLSELEDANDLPFGQLVQGMKALLPEHTDMGMATKMLRSSLDSNRA